ESENFVEPRSRELVDRSTPDCTGIVDQHVDPVEGPCHEFGEIGDPLGSTEVGGMRDHVSDSGQFRRRDSHASALRDEMITRAPASAKPRAIINPIPRVPPVTTTVLRPTSNRPL